MIARTGFRPTLLPYRFSGGVYIYETIYEEAWWREATLRGAFPQCAVDPSTIRVREWEGFTCDATGVPLTEENAVMVVWPYDDPKRDRPGRLLFYSQREAEKRSSQLSFSQPLSTIDWDDFLGAGWVTADVLLQRLPEHFSFERRDDASACRKFLEIVPRLIIEHNIHGVDIDPRAAQIAGLSLWLRAQRSWKRQGVRPGDRPVVERSNIVCAEPMPGDETQLAAFTKELHPMLAHMVRAIFEQMKLAGEAGSLLKIEEEITGIVREARKAWEKIGKSEGEMFSVAELAKGDRRTGVQLELALGEFTLEDLASVPAVAFFDQAEDEIYELLERYAKGVGEGSYQRRLFAEDAARGFAFIDLCRKRYDAVVMNPPFGEPSAALLQLLGKNFADFNKNLLCAFLFQAYEMRSENGKIGSIFDRTAIVKNTYEKFRRAFFVADDRLETHCDLGWEVLDANVETAASVLGEAQGRSHALFFDVRQIRSEDKGPSLLENIASAQETEIGAEFSISPGSAFSRFPNAVLGHDFPNVVKQWFARLPNFREQGVQVLAGHTILADRYFRYWWEVPLADAFRVGASWQRLYNGGNYSRFTSPLCDAVFYGIGGSLIKEHKSTILRNPRLQQTGKLGFGKRGEFIDAHVLPCGFVSSVEGQAVVMHGNADAWKTLALLNSTLFQAVINLYCGQHKYPGYVHLFPCAEWANDALHSASEAAIQAFSLKEQLETSDDTHPRFLNSQSLRFWKNDHATRQKVAM